MSRFAFLEIALQIRYNNYIGQSRVDEKADVELICEYDKSVISKKGTTMRRKVYIILFSVLLLGSLLFGCTGEKQKGIVTKPEETTDTSEYDEVLNMVFLDADYEKQTVTLQALTDGTRYVLNYNGGTLVNSAYGSPVTMEQIEQGELVQASFYYKNSRLKELVLLKDAWEIEATSDVEMERSENLMKVLNKNYKYDDKIVVFSETELVDLSQVHEEDVLTIRGIGNKVYSVTVDSGHGYIVLKGYDSFVGGWVEVGKIITSIKEDMIIVAPEGEYKLTVEKNGFGGYKNIVVKRDRETEVDVSDLKEDALKTGNIRFRIEPEGAVLKIAGAETDYTDLVPLDYGVYKIVVTAEGYDTYTRNITVDSLLKSVDIALTKEGEEDQDEEDTESTEKETSKTEEETTTEAAYKIKITAPAEFEVYFDGEYKGVAPVNFTKVTGSHTITLRKDGYVTKSYTVEIDNDKEDLSMAFPELEKKASE